MNRYEFMKKLEDLLSDIPPSERDEALGFYEDYLDDAGPENEAAILEELESPEKVAKIVRAGMEAADDNVGEFTERGYEDTRFAREKDIPDIIHGVPMVKGGKKTKKDDGAQDKTASGHTAQDGGYTGGKQGKSAYTGGDYGSRYGSAHDDKRRGYSERYGNAPKMSRGSKIALIVILCIFAIPVGIPLIAGLFAALAGIIVAMVVAFFGIGITGVVLVVGGLAVTFIGFIKMMVIPGVGLLTGGLGLMIAALGVVAFVFFIWLCGYVLPGFLRWITGLLGRLIHKGGSRA